MKFMTALEAQLLSYPRVTDESAQDMLKLFDAPAHELVVLLLAAIDNDDIWYVSEVLEAAYANHCEEFGDALSAIYQRSC